MRTNLLTLVTALLLGSAAIAQETCNEPGGLQVHRSWEWDHKILWFEAEAEAWIRDACGNRVDVDEIEISLFLDGCDYGTQTQRRESASSTTVKFETIRFPIACRPTVTAQACATHNEIRWCTQQH